MRVRPRGFVSVLTVVPAQGGEVALAEKKKKEEAEKKEKAEESRNRLKARAALFGGQ